MIGAAQAQVSCEQSDDKEKLMKMKKRVQKILSLLLVLVMALSLAACGGSGNSGSNGGNGGGSSSSGNSGDSGSQPSDGSYPVVRMAYTHMFGTPSEAKIEEAMNEILRESAGAEIDLVPVDFGSMQTQFSSAPRAMTGSGRRPLL